MSRTERDDLHLDLDQEVTFKTLHHYPGFFLGPTRWRETDLFSHHNIDLETCVPPYRQYAVPDNIEQAYTYPFRPHSHPQVH